MDICRGFLAVFSYLFTIAGLFYWFCNGIQRSITWNKFVYRLLILSCLHTKILRVNKIVMNIFYGAATNSELSPPILEWADCSGHNAGSGHFFGGVREYRKMSVLLWLRRNHSRTEWDLLDKLGMTSFWNICPPSLESAVSIRRINCKLPLLCGIKENLYITSIRIDHCRMELDL